jgi:class 3 adenylate cyclase
MPSFIAHVARSGPLFAVCEGAIIIAMDDASLRMRRLKETIYSFQKESPQFRKDGYKPAPGTPEEEDFATYQEFLRNYGKRSGEFRVGSLAQRFGEGRRETAQLDPFPRYMEGKRETAQLDGPQRYIEARRREDARIDALVDQTGRFRVPSKPEAGGGEALQPDERQPKATQSQRPQPPVEGARASVSQQGVKADRRRLAAIMFTDIVEYSALTQRNEALAQEVLNDHNRVLRAIFSNHSGTEVKTTGDGFLVEFASALDAVCCAIEVQQTLLGLNDDRPPKKRFQVRIGLHFGDVIRRQNDVSGDTVNIAARITQSAEPGGICLSENVAREVENKLQVENKPNVHLEKMGRRKLKNIQKPVKLYRVALSP